MGFVSVSAIIGISSGNAVAQFSDRFIIKSVRENLCFDVANNRVSNGTAIQVVPCKGLNHPAQTWIRGNKMPNYPCADAEGGCLFQIKLAANPSFCLDYEFSTRAPAEGAGLQLWQCKDARNGNSAYWGVGRGNFPGGRLYPGVPGVGVFDKLASVSVNSKEGERIRLRTEDENNFYRYWQILD
jgi:hypothetical protein